MTALATPPLADLIAELRRLHEEATQAPWFADGLCVSAVNTAYPDERMVLAEWFGGDRDRHLMVAARNALPRLLLAAERAEEMARALERVEWTEVDEYDDEMDRMRTRRQCPACGEYHPDDPEGGGHTLTCSTRRALAAWRGSP